MRSKELFFSIFKIVRPWPSDSVGCSIIPYTKRLQALIPSQSIHISFMFNPKSGHVQEVIDWSLHVTSISLSLYLPPSLSPSLPSFLSKINKYIIRWGFFKNKKDRRYSMVVLFFWQIEIISTKEKVGDERERVETEVLLLSGIQGTGGEINIS